MMYLYNSKYFIYYFHTLLLLLYLHRTQAHAADYPCQYQVGDKSYDFPVLREKLRSVDLSDGSYVQFELCGAVGGSDCYDTPVCVIRSGVVVKAGSILTQNFSTYTGGVQVQYTQGSTCRGASQWRSTWMINCSDEQILDPDNVSVEVDDIQCQVTIRMNSRDGCSASQADDNANLVYPFMAGLLIFFITGCVWLIKLCLCPNPNNEQQQQSRVTTNQPSVNETSPLLSLSLPTFINEIDEKWQLEPHQTEQCTIQIDDEVNSDNNNNKPVDNNDGEGAGKDGSEEAQKVLEKMKGTLPTDKRTSIDNDPENTCKICFERRINCALVQCGHTTCATCATSLSSCPFCRKPIATRVKLYY